MTATYTWDVLSTLDGYGSFAEGADWGGYWGKQGPELLEHRAALFDTEQRMVFGATTFREAAQTMSSGIDPNTLDEGDLIIGKANQTAIGTLVERATGYVMLLHLPDGYKPEQVRDALAAKIKTLPDSLRLSLTWDQGIEMNEWEHVSVDADIDIYFCDPHAPWQRGTNENTNGLLRQYFPKGADLGVHSSEDLDWVAQELNDRPRKRLAFKKPIELIGDLLLQ